MVRVLKFYILFLELSASCFLGLCGFSFSFFMKLYRSVIIIGVVMKYGFKFCFCYSVPAMISYSSACPVGKMGIITVYTQFQGLNNELGCLASNIQEKIAIVFLYFFNFSQVLGTFFLQWSSGTLLKLLK